MDLIHPVEALDSALEPIYLLRFDTAGAKGEGDTSDVGDHRLPNACCY